MSVLQDLAKQGATQQGAPTQPAVVAGLIAGFPIAAWDVYIAYDKTYDEAIRGGFSPWRADEIAGIAAVNKGLADLTSLGVGSLFGLAPGYISNIPATSAFNLAFDPYTTLEFHRIASTTSIHLEFLILASARSLVPALPRFPRIPLASKLSLSQGSTILPRASQSRSLATSIAPSRPFRACPMSSRLRVPFPKRLMQTSTPR